jgi:hypothetical protein
MSITKTRKLGYSAKIVIKDSQNGIRASSLVVAAKCSGVDAVDLCQRTKITRHRNILIQLRIPYSRIDSTQFSSYAPS